MNRVTLIKAGVVTLFLHVGWMLLHQYALNALVDGIVYRLPILLALGAFIAYISNPRITPGQLGMAKTGILSLLTLHLAWLSYLNQYQIYYLVGELLIVSASCLLFSKRLELYSYAAFLGCLNLTLHFFFDPQNAHFVVLFAGATELVIAFFALEQRQAMKKIQNEQEIKLAKSQARIKAAMDGSLHAIFIFDVKTNGNALDFIFSETNKKGMEYSKNTGLQLEGTTISQICKMLQIPDFKERLEKVYKVNQAFEDEIQIKSPDGTSIWMHILAVPIENGLFLSAKNINNRKELEERIRRNEMALQKAQTVSRIAHYEINVNERNLTHSPQLAILLGLPFNHQISSRDILQMTLPEDVSKVRLSWSRAIKKRTQMHWEFRLRRPDGLVISLENFSWPVFDDSGALVSFFGTIQDITERKNHEELIRSQQVKLVQSAKLSSLGEMAAGIAHEINNPLAVISGSAQQVLRISQQSEVDKTKLHHAAERISKTSFRIAKIVQGLRTFAREGSNDPCEAIPFVQVVNDSLELCRSRFMQNGIDLRVNQISGDLIVECQAVQISQVLVNLLQNAFDAIKESENPWVSLDTQAQGDWLLITVTDSGHGISQEISEKIMQPFFTTKEVGKGTGLGLSISSSILANHGGSLEIDHNCPNTRFVIKLPFKAKQNDAPISMAS